MNRPTLSADFADTRQVKAWRLYANLTFSCERSFSLRIRHSAGENTIVRLVHEDGEEREALTWEEFNERLMCVRMHEDMSDADARDWLSARAIVISGAQVEIFVELERYWVALSMLLNPVVTF
jgi:hypothetical protein